MEFLISCCNFFYLAGDVSMNDVNAILSVVNDRSLHSLQSIISALLNKAIDESIDESTVVKTVCERYILKTSVSAIFPVFDYV